MRESLDWYKRGHDARLDKFSKEFENSRTLDLNQCL
jgi:hypothetical protein